MAPLNCGRRFCRRQRPLDEVPIEQRRNGRVLRLCVWVSARVGLVQRPQHRLRDERIGHGGPHSRSLSASGCAASSVRRHDSLTKQPSPPSAAETGGAGKGSWPMAPLRPIAREEVHAPPAPPDHLRLGRAKSPCPRMIQVAGSAISKAAAMATPVPRRSRLVQVIARGQHEKPTAASTS